MPAVLRRFWRWLSRCPASCASALHPIEIETLEARRELAVLMGPLPSAMLAEVATYPAEVDAVIPSDPVQPDGSVDPSPIELPLDDPPAEVYVDAFLDRPVSPPTDGSVDLPVVEVELIGSSSSMAPIGAPGLNVDDIVADTPRLPETLPVPAPTTGGDAITPTPAADPQTQPESTTPDVRLSSTDGPPVESSKSPETNGKSVGPRESANGERSAPTEPPTVKTQTSAQLQQFRISRPTPGDEPMTVRYSLNYFASDAATTREGEVVIPAGKTAAEVAIPASNNGAATQIVTLNVQPTPHYRVGKSAAAWFVLPAAQCDEAVLMAAHQFGQSEEAFSALVRRHQTTVLQTCMKLVGNSADAEDLSQWVFLVLAQRHGPAPASLSRWLRKVARNASISWLRSRRRRAQYEQQVAKSSAVNDPSEESISVLEQIEAALGQLPDPLRQAVELRYLEGRSQKEAAQLVGCPRGTLSQRAARGMSWLRALMSPTDT